MRPALVLTLLLLATAPARAGQITVEFEGILSVVSGLPGVDAGAPFSGTYSYDDAVAIQMLTPESGLYDLTGVSSSFSLLIHGAIPAAFAGSPLRDITVTNGAGGDSMIVIATTGPSGNFRLDLVGESSLLSSLDLVVPDLAQGGGTLQYTNLETGFVLLMGTLTSLTPVPEPSSAALLCLATAGLAWREARARRK